MAAFFNANSMKIGLRLLFLSKSPKFEDPAR